MCAIAGIYGVNNASFQTWLMLLALLHRGQNGSGLAARNSEGLIDVRRKAGLATAFRDYDFGQELPGQAAIGQNRYPITGGDKDINRQPFVRKTRFSQVAVVHNGNLTNNLQLRKKLEGQGVVFEAETDTELIPVLYGLSEQEDEVARLTEVFGQLEGSFSVIGLTKTCFFAIRDPQGMRPLFMARTPDGATVFASETRAFNILASDTPVTDIKEVSPGHLILVRADHTVKQHRYAPATDRRFCSFEGTYTAKNDSIVGDHANAQVAGKTYRLLRMRTGHRLAQCIKDNKVLPDVVVGVPSTGTIIARACADALCLPFADSGLERNEYIQRTFIENDSQRRELDLRLKLNPNPDVFRGAKVLLVDDSLVRGWTSRALVKIARQAGAAAVHLGFGCPPVVNPCFWAGMATRERTQLIATQHPLNELPQILGADSVTFLTLPRHLDAQGDPQGLNTCWACLDPLRRRPVLHHTLDFPGYDQ